MVGRETSQLLVSPALPARLDAGTSSWRRELVVPGAAYLSLHFAELALPAGAWLEIAAPDGSRREVLRDRGRLDLSRGGFWAMPISGERLLLSLHSMLAVPAGAVVVDKVAAGDGAALSEVPPGPKALCGGDESRWAPCYAEGEPEAYRRSRAVARLIINGSLACTGWLVGSAGHVMTNAHCLSFPSSAANTSFEFAAEGASCAQDCASHGGCPGVVEATSSTLVAFNRELDYSLVQLPVNPSERYGYLQLREGGPELDEPIYIPQHPGAWGKRIAMEASDGPARITELGSRPCYGGQGDVSHSGDTDTGSSGAPVLGRRDHLVVALHHCGDCPNRAVPISAVIEDLGPALPPDALPGGGCEPRVVADAGPDQVVCRGAELTLGSAGRPGHAYEWSTGARTAQITVRPERTTEYLLTSQTSCGRRQDRVTVVVDDGSYTGLEEDFEQGAAGWTTTGLWHLSRRSGCASPAHASPVHAMYHGDEESCTYDTGAPIKGTLVSPLVAGIQADSVLRFRHLREVERFSGQQYDTTRVEASSDDGRSWAPLWQRSAADPAAPGWESSGDISLGQYAGSGLRLRFIFDSVDDDDNDHLGWFLDDVQVTRRSLCSGARAGG